MGGEELMEDESGMSSDPEKLAMEIENCENKVNKLQEKIALEDAKMEKYRVWHCIYINMHCTSTHSLLLIIFSPPILWM